VGRRNQVFGNCLKILFIPLFIVSCVSISELNVSYRLPPSSDVFKGAKIGLKIEDGRSTKEILGEGAKKEIHDFSGNLSFSVARHSEPEFKVGIYKLGPMMKEAFKRRLRNEGLKVSFKEDFEIPRLLIVLKEFLLDRSGQKWFVRIEYEARLMKEGKLLSSQGIHGGGERYGLIGTGPAETVLGEIFTDAVNKLDINELFRQAGL